MKRKVFLTQSDFSDFLSREVESTTAFSKLTDLLERKVQGELALALSGELDDDTSVALEELKRALREAAADKTKRHKELTDNIVDDSFALAALEFDAKVPSDEQVADAILAVFKQVKQNLGEILVNKETADFSLAKESRDFRTPNEEVEGDIIIAAGDKPPAIPEPEDLFPNSGDENVQVHWYLRESLQQINCEQETDGWGSDDIVFRGAYRWNGRTRPLAVTSAEKSYSTGRSHTYQHGRDAMGHSVPHGEVELVDSGGYLPKFYLSSHMIVEADDLDFIVKALGAFVGGVVEKPISNAAGAAAGQLGITGVGAAASIGGAILDSVVDAVTDGMLTAAGQSARRVIFNTFRGVRASDNIIFQPWFTGVSVTWKSVIGSKYRQPRWKVRHSIAGKSWDAQQRSANPKVGQGTLSPGKFRGDTDIVLVPELWKGKTSTATIPNGRYSYMSHIYVYREVRQGV